MSLLTCRLNSTRANYEDSTKNSANTQKCNTGQTKQKQYGSSRKNKYYELRAGTNIPNPEKKYTNWTKKGHRLEENPIQCSSRLPNDIAAYLHTRLAAEIHSADGELLKLAVKGEYSSPNIVRVKKSRRMRWAGHVARMGEERGMYRVLLGKPEGKRPLGRPRRRWVDNIRMDLQEVGCGYMDRIGRAQDRDRWRTLVSAVMNLRVPWNAGSFLTSCKPVSCSKRTLHHGVSKHTLVTLSRTVTPYRDSVEGTRDRVTYQKLVTR